MSDECQYCGADLEARPPGREVGYLYGVECSRCPPGKRQSQMLARDQRVDALCCPGCAAVLSPAEKHPDVLVIKEMTYDVCPDCGARCGVSAVRKLRDVSGGTM
jgi:hypothetical protein